MDADFVEQRQVEIGQRNRLRVCEVTVAFHSGRRAASDDDRQVRMVVNVRIADPAPVKNERMVEQRAVAFGRGFQFLQEPGEERNVERIDLRHPLDLGRVIAVMRQRVMRIGNADLGVSAIARLARELERDRKSVV